MSELTKERLIIAIRWLCMALFLYTAYAKIIDHDRFLKGLKRVHLIHGFAVLLSFAVPVVEIMVAVLLLIPKTSELGLKSFIAVMSSFTIYIVSAMIWEKKLPCHCGGAIEKLSWTQHLWFNLAFIAIAVFALLLIKLKTILKFQKMKNFKQLALGLMVGAMAIGFSSFTNAPTKAKFSTRYWGNDGTNYNLLSSAPNPSTDCGGGSSTAECSVESTDTSIPNSFPIGNPSHYNVSTVPGSTDAVYEN